MVTQFLQGWWRASRREVWGCNRGEAAIAIRMWQGGGQSTRHRKVFLWCVYCEGCIWCLEGEECAARKFKDKDESRWVLQKWEEEVQVGKILHPTRLSFFGGASL